MWLVDRRQFSGSGVLAPAELLPGIFVMVVTVAVGPTAWKSSTELVLVNRSAHAVTGINSANEIAAKLMALPKF